MAKIKHTKNELKAQGESLKRFKRFLPMLILKKQQLQAEIQRIDQLAQEKTTAEETLQSQLDQWIKLFSESDSLRSIVDVQKIQTEEGNIAGVNIPVFKNFIVEYQSYDIYSTPTWHDDAVDSISALAKVRAE